MNFSVIIGILAVFCALVLADSADKPKTLENIENSVKDLIEIESDNDTPESQRKRDSGYYYSRPSNPYDSHRSTGPRIKFAPRLPSQRVKPFNRYGPPNYSSQSNRPFGQTVPSPIRNNDFSDVNPITSQNDTPFRPNSVNYLPPKNQKPPKTSSPGIFQPSRPIIFSDNNNNNQANNFFPNTFPQQQNLIQNPSQEFSTSDESLFLTQNAHKIAQLYETPATNFNYPPYDNFENSNIETKNPNSQFQIIVPDPTQIPEQIQQNSQGFTGPIPSYSDGILETPRILERLQSQEKDRIISQLQQALSSKIQDPTTSEYIRYAQNYGQTIKNENILSSIGTQTSQLDKLNSFNNQGHQSVSSSFGSESPSSSFGQSSSLGSDVTFQGHHNYPINYGLPQITTTTTPPTIISLPSHRPQNNGNNNQENNLPSSAIPPISFPYPQYNGFLPTLITGTNFISNIPNYGTNIVNSNPLNKPEQSSTTSPTHFALPLPLLPDIKPINTGSTSLNPNLEKPFHPVTLPHPQIPFHHIHQISTNQIQPIIPVVSTSTNIHPTYGVNSVFVKPVKPVYPVYYYHQNIQNTLKKPSLVSPWNYAPAYSQRKSSKILK